MGGLDDISHVRTRRWIVRRGGGPADRREGLPARAGPVPALERSELAQRSGAATIDGTRPADVPDTRGQRRPAITQSRWSCGSQATSSSAGLRRCSIQPPRGVSRPDVSLRRWAWAGGELHGGRRQSSLTRTRNTASPDGPSARAGAPIVRAPRRTTRRVCPWPAPTASPRDD